MGIFIQIIGDDEEWKSLDCLNIKRNVYMISNYGRIYSNIKNRIIEPSVHCQGYHHITLLTVDNMYKKFLVHRLVAYTFIDNSHDKKIINHRDGIKLNNYYKNLEWCTYSENLIHAYANNLNRAKDIFKTKYNHSGNPNFKYSDEMIHYICDKLEKGYKPSDVAKLFITKYPQFKYKSVHKYISSKIKSRLKRTDVSNKYNF